ncbi:MAG TPA: FIST N-terminal domain-containing protein [Puia sp.]|nr:FIST N-terminal domain-containing protein [Puia sp.]
MKIAQTQYFDNQWRTDSIPDGFDLREAQLVMAFGDPALVTNAGLFSHIRSLFPRAAIVSSSTAGEILQENVYDNSLVVTAIQFEKTKIRCKVSNIKQHSSSYTTGMHLMKALVGEADDLIAVFIISDGTHINGSELVSGFSENNPKCIPVTGGLAGDGARFTRTFAGLDQVPEEGNVVAVGFYGDSLKIGHGSFGGWDEFGPVRTITRSDKNILYEIDCKNALDLYKEYLGPYKEELPGSALLFPLSIREPDSAEHLVRTILSINEQEKSMLFAGNMSEGSKIRLMKANFDRLIDGSSMAAKNSFNPLENSSPDLALLISCVGRKLVLQERTDEEVQAVKQIFGDRTPLAGFYSYGEISPFNLNTRCELHNQTMTITTFSES